MSSLFVEVLHKPLWMWLAFLVLVLSLLVLDLGVLNRKPREIGVRESLAMSAFYITIGLLFGGWVWWVAGQQSALEYVTGFVVEKTLAMDNIFVIAMIFAYFKVPRAYQHRVLFWGILGVIVLRGLMIGFGLAIIHQFEWVMYLFAAFLIFTGIKMLFSADDGEGELDLSKSRILRFMQRHLRMSKQFDGHNFFVRKAHPKTGKLVLYATPLFMALVMIELADVMFAVDSIPAIFAITTDPYVVYTSNIFAILGLRALYFALAAMISRFAYLKYALSVVLVFIGGKIFVADMLGLMKIPPAISLCVTVGILLAGVAFSLWRTGRNGAA